MSPSLDQIIGVFHAASVTAYLPFGSRSMPAGFVEVARIRTKAGVDTGFVAYNAVTKTALVATPGTRTVHDWVHDFDAVPVPYPGGEVHAGFKSAYEEVRDSIFDGIANHCPGALSVWITGHSLGAAIATLCAWELYEWDARGLRPTVVTFEGPRVGSPTFAASFDAAITDCTRVVNFGDVVPEVPTPPFYLHVGKKLVVYGGFHPWHAAYAHGMDRVLVGLLKLQQQQQNQTPKAA